MTITIGQLLYLSYRHASEAEHVTMKATDLKLKNHNNVLVANSPKVRGAVGDADVIVLVSDVYGEPLADAKIMQK